MRLSLQLVIGLTLVTLLPVGLTVLSISLLLSLGARVATHEQGAEGGLAAARDALEAYLSSEVARLGTVGEVALDASVRALSLALGRLEGRAVDPGTKELAAEARASLARGVGGRVAVEGMESLLRGAVDLETRARDSLRKDVVRYSRSGLGLVAILGGTGLFSSLLFGFWLTRTIGHPIERMAEGVGSIHGGDLHRRLEERSHVRVISRLAQGVNALADRLQRGELDRQVDFLLAAAALETLLDQRGLPTGILTPGKRLLVANEAARRLADEKRSSFARLAAELGTGLPSAVEVTVLRGVGKSVLGELVTLRIPEETVPKGPAEG